MRRSVRSRPVAGRDRLPLAGQSPLIGMSGLAEDACELARVSGLCGRLDDARGRYQTAPQRTATAPLVAEGAGVWA